MKRIALLSLSLFCTLSTVAVIPAPVPHSASAAYIDNVNQACELVNKIECEKIRRNALPKIAFGACSLSIATYLALLLSQGKQTLNTVDLIKREINSKHGTIKNVANITFSYIKNCPYGAVCSALTGYFGIKGLLNVMSGSLNGLLCLLIPKQDVADLERQLDAVNNQFKFMQRMQLLNFAEQTHYKNHILPYMESALKAA